MKTSVEIDERKVKLAKKLTDVSTLKELIDRALEEYIAGARRRSIAAMLGTEFFEGSLDKMRKKQHGRSDR